MVVVSSCREVSAWCHNERNPRRQLLTGNAEDSAGTAGARREEGGDDVKSARLFTSGGDTRVTMGGTAGSQAATPSGTRKAVLSSDRSLQPDSVKLDSLVIAHQPWRGEYVPALYTPPVKPWELGA